MEVFKLTEDQKSRIKKLDSVKALEEPFCESKLPKGFATNRFFIAIEGHLSECFRSSVIDRKKSQTKAGEKLENIKRLSEKLKLEFDELNKVAPHIAWEFSNRLWGKYLDDDPNHVVISKSNNDVFGDPYINFGRRAPMNQSEACSVFIDVASNQKSVLSNSSFDDELKALFRAWHWSMLGELRGITAGHDFIKMCCIVFESNSSYTEAETCRRLKRCEWWIDLQ